MFQTAAQSPSSVVWYRCGCIKHWQWRQSRCLRLKLWTDAASSIFNKTCQSDLRHPTHLISVRFEVLFKRCCASQIQLQTSEMLQSSECLWRNSVSSAMPAMIWSGQYWAGSILVVYSLNHLHVKEKTKKIKNILFSTFSILS